MTCAPPQWSKQLYMYECELENIVEQLVQIPFNHVVNLCIYTHKFCTYCCMI